MGALHSDLMHASRLQHHFEQRRAIAKEVDRAKFAAGVLAILPDHDEALAPAPLVGHEGRRNDSRLMLPAPRHKREIAFFHLTRAKELVQPPQSAALLRNDKASARAAIESVRELQVGCLGPQCPQRLYGTQPQATASMDGKATWFVEHENPLVLMDYPFGKPAEVLLRRLGGGTRSHGRNSYLIAGRQTVEWLRPTAVHAHLTGSDESVDVALRHALEFGEKKVIQPLSRDLFRNDKLLDFASCC